MGAISDGMKRLAGEKGLTDFSMKQLAPNKFRAAGRLGEGQKCEIEVVKDENSHAISEIKATSPECVRILKAVVRENLQLD